MEWGSRK